MSVVATGNTNEVKVFVTRGRVSRFLGIVAGLFSCGFVCMAIQAVATRGRPTHQIVILLLGGLLLAATSYLFLRPRAAAVVDRERRVVEELDGISGLMRAHPLSVEGIDCVVVLFERRFSWGRRGRKHYYNAYPIRFKGCQADSLEIAAPRELLEARRIGEGLAKFLEVDLVDRSAGDAVVRGAKELDAPLRDRAKSLMAGTKPVAAPAKRRSRYAAADGTVRFSFPAPGMSCGLAFQVLVSLGVGGLTACLAVMQLPVYSARGSEAWVSVVGVGLFAVLCLGSAISALWTGLAGRSSVEVGPSGLTVVNRGLFGSKETRIPADALEQIEVAEVHQLANPRMAWALGAKALVAYCDEYVVTFGRGLAEEELRWIRDTLIRGLASMG